MHTSKQILKIISSNNRSDIVNFINEFGDDFLYYIDNLNYICEHSNLNNLKFFLSLLDIDKKFHLLDFDGNINISFCFESILENIIAYSIKNPNKKALVYVLSLYKNYLDPELVARFFSHIFENYDKQLLIYYYDILFKLKLTKGVKEHLLNEKLIVFKSFELIEIF